MKATVKRVTTHRDQVLGARVEDEAGTVLGRVRQHTVYGWSPYTPEGKRIPGKYRSRAAAVARLENWHRGRRDKFGYGPTTGYPVHTP